MAHYGTLKDAPVAQAGEDVRGSHVYGWNDERLGKIDDVIFDHFYRRYSLPGWTPEAGCTAGSSSTMKRMSAGGRSGAFRRTTSRTWSPRVRGKVTRTDIARSGWRILSCMAQKRIGI